MLQFYCSKHEARLTLKDGFRGFPDYYSCPKCNYKVPLVETHKIERMVEKGKTKFSTYHTNVNVIDDKAYIERRKA